MNADSIDKSEKLYSFLMEYFRYLREEINLRVTRHSYLVIYKLIAIGAILSFILESQDFSFNLLDLVEKTRYIIWVIPLISAIFDHVIMGNLRVVANIGIYLREYYEENILDQWKRRDPILGSFEFWESCGAHEKTKWRCYTTFDMFVISSITFLSVLLPLGAYVYLYHIFPFKKDYLANVAIGVCVGLLSFLIFAEMCKITSGKRSFGEFLKESLENVSNILSKNPGKEVVTMKKLQKDIAEYLDQEGLSEINEEMAKIIAEYTLKWKIGDKGNPEETNTIFAFSFGYRLDKNGSRKPGPINRQLADKVVEYYKRKPKTIYAQCSIYEVLSGKIEEEDLIPIYPETDRERSITKHLSTKDVLRKIAEKLEPRNPEEIGPVLIVAHRDHLVRCVRMAEEMGFTVITAQNEMPKGYDEKSAQLWTTNRLTYIVSDIISRLATYRETDLYSKKGLES